jgi:hypothetical protein
LTYFILLVLVIYRHLLGFFLEKVRIIVLLESSKLSFYLLKKKRLCFPFVHKVHLAAKSSDERLKWFQFDEVHDQLHCTCYDLSFLLSLFMLINGAC